MYPQTTDVESFSDIKRARRHRALPAHSGYPAAPRQMDRNQTMEVRGHQDGKWSLVPTTRRFDNRGGRFGIDHIAVARPPPVPAVNRELKIFVNTKGPERWQTADRARGPLVHRHYAGSGSSSARKATSPRRSAFWRSEASAGVSIEELCRRTRSKTKAHIRQLTSEHSSLTPRASELQGLVGLGPQMSSSRLDVQPWLTSTIMSDRGYY